MRALREAQRMRSEKPDSARVMKRRALRAAPSSRPRPCPAPRVSLAAGASVDCGSATVTLRTARRSFNLPRAPPVPPGGRGRATGGGSTNVPAAQPPLQRGGRRGAAPTGTSSLPPPAWRGEDAAASGRGAPSSRQQAAAAAATAVAAAAVRVARSVGGRPMRAPAEQSLPAQFVSAQTGCCGVLATHHTLITAHSSASQGGTVRGRAPATALPPAWA